MLCQSLEVFQMEVGLSTNIFSKDFKLLGHLASHGWWKHFWQLCSKFQVSVTLSRKYIIPLLQEDNHSFMDVICATDMYPKEYQLAVQWLQRFKDLHSLGDFVLIDGGTIDPFVLTRELSDSSRVFSVEKPTCADFRMFCLLATELTGMVHGSQILAPSQAYQLELFVPVSSLPLMAWMTSSCTPLPLFMFHPLVAIAF
ncbi:hypothetical protein ACHAWX_005317 [Stephanocyclus meneghinianus]